MNDRAEPELLKKSVLSLLPALVLLLAGCSAETLEAEDNEEGTVAAPVATPALAERIDQLAQRVMADEMIPGAAVVVVKDGMVLHEKGYGVADVVSGRPVDPQKTVFRIGSVSKALTAIAVSRLIDHGKISMDDPVQAYFPALADSANSGGGEQPVRIRHLLTHTAGFDQIGIGRQVSDPQKSLDERLAARPTISEFLANDNLRRTSPPGLHYRYDTYAITLAGAVLESVTGLRYSEAMEQELFKPLGMADSSVALDPRNRQNLAVGHGAVDGKLARMPFEVYVTQPASSIDATPADMGRLLQALTAQDPVDDGKWLSDEMRAKILAPQYRPHSEFPGVTHGLNEYYAMDIAEDQPVRVVGHGGSMLGFQTSLMLLPEKGLGVVVFSNRNQEAGGVWVSLHDQINQLVFGAFYAGDAFTGFQIPAPDRARNMHEYAGDFYYGVYCQTCTEDEFRSGGWPASNPLTVQIGDGGLRLRDQNYYPSADKDVFVRADGLNKIAFRRDGKGGINSFSFYTSPDTFERRNDKM